MVYIHLEALLTRSSGHWQMLMEYQKAMATTEEWEKLVAFEQSLIQGRQLIERLVNLGPPPGYEIEFYAPQ